MNKQFDWVRIGYFVIASLISVLAAILGKDWILDNSDARNMIATTFSILAGFLVSVIAITADERSIRASTWRHSAIKLEDLKARLFRHQLTFMLYLGVLVVVFVRTLKLPLSVEVKALLDQVMLGLATMAFLLSFRLPGHLMREHMKLLDEKIKQQKTGSDMR